MTVEPVVEASEDGQSFTITKSAWAGTYPIDALPRELKFYRQREQEERRLRPALRADGARLRGIRAAKGITQNKQCGIQNNAIRQFRPLGSGRGPFSISGDGIFTRLFAHGTSHGYTLAIFRGNVPPPNSTGVPMSRAALFLCLPFVASFALPALGEQPSLQEAALNAAVAAKCRAQLGDE
ncbi:hypothetical protein [Pseudorhodobacter sp.]|uniref:hypothetical protein n=1 Tax=Pseudorhodobacter sp. TaxID=1934400 RepID=UPI002AFED75D|nr:hypothetical protein [Pseudorhodobacter sp.]